MHRPGFIALCLGLPGVSANQSHPLVGQWNICVPTMVRGENGQPTSVLVTGRMTVTMVGDSLVAVVKMEPVPGQPASKERRAVGAGGAGTVRLSYSSDATLVGGNADLSRRASTTYVLDVKGDSLDGTLQLAVEGIPDIPPRPVKGTRANKDQGSLLGLLG